MRYRKRPIIINAEHFTQEIIDSFKETDGVLPFGVYHDKESKTGFSIDTLEGKHEVTPGDWIITGIAGEKYPCKPDIFDRTYEKVDPTTLS